MADDFKKLLAAEFAAYQVLSEAQLEALETHYDLLCKWNKKLNLCRIKDLGEAVQLHYCESLYLAHLLPAGPLRILDVGSGAGFPGIPIGILRIDCEIDLLESDQRKAAFLREACHGLENLHVIAVRAETCAETYDWMVSRAVRAETIQRLALAPNCAILTSVATAAKSPWGERRFIQMFHVEL